MRKLMSIVFCLVFSGAALAAGQNKETNRLESAAYIVNEIMQTPEKGIPRDLLGRARSASWPRPSTRLITCPQERRSHGYHSTLSTRRSSRSESWSNCELKQSN